MAVFFCHFWEVGSKGGVPMFILLVIKLVVFLRCKFYQATSNHYQSSLQFTLLSRPIRISYIAAHSWDDTSLWTQTYSCHLIPYIYMIDVFYVGRIEVIYCNLWGAKERERERVEEIPGIQLGLKLRTFWQVWVPAKSQILHIHVHVCNSHISESHLTE